MSETNYAVAPGEYLLEWMKENDNPHSRLYVADKMEWSYNEVWLFIVGLMRTTQTDRERLFELTGIPARTWMNYEMQYNKDLVRLWEND